MRNRISRTFLAAIAATALTASMGAAGSTAATGSASATCKWEGFKITKRHNVTCRKAKRVLKGETTGRDEVPGWKCTKGTSVIPEGKCRNAARTKSFRYAYTG